MALGALVGASVAGGIVAVAGHTDRTTTVTAGNHAGGQRGEARPARGRPLPRPSAIATLVQKAEPSVVSIHDNISQTNSSPRSRRSDASSTSA